MEHQIQNGSLIDMQMDELDRAFSRAPRRIYDLMELTEAAECQRIPHGYRDGCLEVVEAIVSAQSEVSLPEEQMQTAHAHESGLLTG